jgi:ribosomal peptide maturation radical SAM protein 1
MKIGLINMPFAGAHLPSIALTQLKSIVKERLDDRATVSIHYLNHDFVQYMGKDLYGFMSDSMDAHNSGIGDWLFRQLAFPDLPDNTTAYFQRFFPYRTPQHTAFKEQILAKRRGLDAFLDSLIATYALDQLDLVGFTSMFNQNIASFALARKLKVHNPQIITVLGGANCEAPMGHQIAKHVPQIDYVFSGAALKSFPEFIRRRIDGDGDSQPIKGILTKSNCDLLSGHADVGEELDIDVPIELDYDQFLTSLENKFPDGETKPVLLFETSRGCWWGQRMHCTFCGLNGSTMAYRAMSSENALKQFQKLFAHADKVTRYESVDNILPKEYLRDVFPVLETPPGSYLFYEVKADLSESDMQVLQKARVKTVQPGIESLASSTLKLMKKGTTAFQNLLLLKNCLLYDIYPSWNLLVGFPGEEEPVYKKYLRDLPLLTHLPPPIGSFPVRFDRYSPYFTKAKEYGLDLHPVDYYELSYPFSADSLANLAYYFTDRNVSANYMTVMIKWIDQIRVKVSHWFTRWHGMDHLIPPQLYFKENSTIVYDSRSGKVVEHDVQPAGRLVLESISSKPARMGAIAAAIEDTVDVDAARIMASLQSRGLVFEEDGRYFSLVLPKETQKMSILEMTN